VEALDLADRDLAEVSIGRVAEYLCEEVDALLLIEQVILLALSIGIRTSVSVLVDPFKEKSLVHHKVRLLHKHLPETINVLGTQGYLVLGVNNKELKESKHLVQSVLMSVFADENVS